MKFKFNLKILRKVISAIGLVVAFQFWCFNSNSQVCRNLGESFHSISEMFSGIALNARLGFYTILAEQSEDRFDEIKFERTECFGGCPIYSIVIKGDGSVEYEGKGWVKNVGKISATLSERKLVELTALIGASDYHSISLERNSARDCGTDAPYVNTAVTTKDWQHSIYHYIACGAPAGLTFFETSIESILNTEQWIGTPEERKEIVDTVWGNMH
jgi:hypothetical protein